MRSRYSDYSMEFTVEMKMVHSGLRLWSPSHMSRLRACGPVIPGIPRLAGVGPARYASGRYGDQVHYGDGILFLFVGGLTH